MWPKWRLFIRVCYQPLRSKMWINVLGKLQCDNNRPQVWRARALSDWLFAGLYGGRLYVRWAEQYNEHVCWAWDTLIMTYNHLYTRCSFILTHKLTGGPNFINEATEATIETSSPNITAAVVGSVTTAVILILVVVIVVLVRKNRCFSIFHIVILKGRDYT